MQRYSPIYDDPEGNLPAMQEDSDDGDWYHRADVDPRIAELHRIVATLWNDVDPADYDDIRDAVLVELAQRPTG